MDIRKQAVTGVVPPLVAEARIRETWPSVAAFPAVARLGKLLTNTIVLAPLAWMLMAGPYFLKLLPITMRRYTLTNRRLMIRGGWAGTPLQEIPLTQIDEVRLVLRDKELSDFFRAADLEIVSGGQVKLTLPGVCDPETFRQAILNSRMAWYPRTEKDKIPHGFIPAK